MKLIIAEKKEQASAIAEALGGNAGKPKDGAYQAGGYTITFLFGHLLELAGPADHNEAWRRWVLQHLPMNWSVAYNPIPRTVKQLKAVIALCQQAQEIIHAGDPDPEGQRLVDEVLEYAEVTGKPTQRLLINDNNPSAINQAMNQMPDNSQFKGLSLSALARAVCDQHYGINLTRLYSLMAQQQGYEGVLSVGRVQTPILGLIVRRDKTHEAHDKTPFYTVQADIELGGITVRASYQPSEDDLTDDKGRLLDKAQAEAIVAEVADQSATLVEVTTKDKQQAAPLPYNLLALQADASSQFGYSPKQVLEITQTLRDKHRAITYNRSDCRYLNEERHGEAGQLIADFIMTPAFNRVASNADPKLKSKAFNSSKVTAHHAIIPTQSIPMLSGTGLSEAEGNIYQLIVRQYLAQFYPPETWRSTTAVFTVGHRQFVAKGRVDMAPGWREVFGKQQPDTEVETDAKIDLESLQQGDSGTVTHSESSEKFTKPLPYYTMATLLKDLPRVAKYASDPKIKKLLLDKDADKQDEMGGIGTPATRDSMIETLFKRGFVQEQGKKLISTSLGRQFIEALPDFATTPDMTALWHEKQHQIETGELDYQVLIDEVMQAVADEVQRVKAEGLPLKIDLPAAPTCPNCDSGVLNRRKGKFGHFWACSNRDNCGSTFQDQSGKPDLTPKAKPEVSEHECPECGKGLIRRQSKKTAKGKNKKASASHWWGCSGFPACKFRAFDKNGKPEIKNESPA